MRFPHLFRNALFLNIFLLQGLFACIPLLARTDRPLPPGNLLLIRSENKNSSLGILPEKLLSYIRHGFGEIRAETMPSNSPDLERLLASGGPDIVLSLDEASADVLLRNRKKISPQTKIVLFGIRDAEKYRVLRNSTGILARHAVSENILFGGSLFPRAEEIAVVLPPDGKPMSGEELRFMMRREPTLRKVRIVFLNISGHGGELDRKLAALSPKKSFVVIAGTRNEWKVPERNLSFRNAIKSIRAKYSGPVLTCVGAGDGSSFEQMLLYIPQISQILERILAGESPAAIAYEPPAEKRVVSRSALSKFGLDPELLPEGTTIRSIVESGVDELGFLGETELFYLLILLLLFLAVLLILFLINYLNSRNLMTKYTRFRAWGINQREQFRTTINAFDFTVIVCGVNGKIEYCNKAAEKLTGYPASEMIGLRADDKLELVRYSDGVYAEGMVEKVLRSGCVQTEDDVFLATLDGEQLPVRASAYPVYAFKRLSWIVIVLKHAQEWHLRKVRGDTSRKYEKMMNELAIAALRDPVLDSLMNRISDRLHTLFVPDRVLLFQFSDECRARTCVYESCAPGLVRLRDKFNARSGDFALIWMNALLREDTFQINMKHPPEWMRLDLFQSLNEQGVRALAVTAVMCDGVLWGYGGVNFINDSYTLLPEDLCLLRFFFSFAPYCSGKPLPARGA